MLTFETLEKNAIFLVLRKRYLAIFGNFEEIGLTFTLQLYSLQGLQLTANTK